MKLAATEQLVTQYSLGRRLSSTRLEETQFADVPVGELAVELIHDVEGAANPSASLFGEDQPEVREPIEHPRQDHRPQRPMGEPGGLHQPNGQRGGVLAVVRRGAAAMGAHDDVALLAGAPHGVVDRGVQRLEGRTGRESGEEHAAT